MKKILLVAVAAVALSTPGTEAEEFAGANFGVGISLTHDIGEESRVSEACVDDNGIVRAQKENNDIARVMLESHYFFENNEGRRFLWFLAPEKWGHGPFLALQPGTDDIIEALGFGWMLGFRKDQQSSESWNLGLGLVIDPSVKVLADGMKENKPLPEGESQIRYKETSQTGLLVLFSFSF